MHINVLKMELAAVLANAPAQPWWSPLRSFSERNTSTSTPELKFVVDAQKAVSDFLGIKTSKVKDWAICSWNGHRMYLDSISVAN